MTLPLEPNPFLRHCTGQDLRGIYAESEFSCFISRERRRRRKAAATVKQRSDNCASAPSPTPAARATGVTHNTTRRGCSTFGQRDLNPQIAGLWSGEPDLKRGRTDPGGPNSKEQARVQILVRGTTTPKLGSSKSHPKRLRSA